MSPSQKDDDGQEWKKVRRVSDHYVRPWDLWFGNRPVAVRLSEADIDAILADHRDAQQLREFMEWLTDQQVVHWTLTEETANDPRKAVEALLQTYLNEINDPTISEVARKAAESDVLRERVRVLEEALRDRAYTLHVFANHPDAFPCPREDCQEVDALVSPAAATEGGEGA